MRGGTPVKARRLLTKILKRERRQATKRQGPPRPRVWDPAPRGPCPSGAAWGLHTECADPAWASGRWAAGLRLKGASLPVPLATLSPFPVSPPQRGDLA